MKTKKRCFLGIFLSVVLVLGMMPAMGAPVFADEGTETWSADKDYDGNQTFNNGVKVTADITLTIKENVTVTVNGGIDATGHTLTVDGGGTLVVKGLDGESGTNHESDPGAGGKGGSGFIGNLTVGKATVNVTGGNGGKGGNSANVGGNGGNGGEGVTGNVTVNDENGTAIVTGGNGGEGGKSDTDESGRAGEKGRAVSGTITATASGLRPLESDTNSNWYDITEGSSQKQCVKVLKPVYVTKIDSLTSTTTSEGKTFPLDADVVPDNVTDPSLEYSSDTPSVATVDGSGKVTCVSAGTAIITITATNGTVDTQDDITATCNVTVRAAVNVLVDVGEGHGHLFTESVLNGLTKKLGAKMSTRDGDTITVIGADPFWSESKMREEIDEAVFALQFGVDNGEKYFDVGYKPIDEYTTYQQFQNDNGSQDHNKEISNNLKYYLFWKMPYKNLEMGNGNPVCGAESMEYIPAPTVPEGMFVHPAHSFWKDAEGGDFETFEGGKEYIYRADVEIPREGTLWKYYFNKDDLSVNVKDGKVEKIEEDTWGPDVEVIVITFRTTAEHDWDEGTIIKDPTCMEKGEKRMTCEHCKATTVVDVDALGHDFGKWTKLNDTQHQRVCSRDKTHVEKADHKWDYGKITKKATYTEEGIKTFTCTVCEGTKTESIPKLEKLTNPLKIKAKTAKIKYKKLKKKAQKLAVTKVIKFVKKSNDKKTYKLYSAKKGKKSFKKYFKISKTNGKTTVKKGLKKGVYKVKIKVKALGNAKYNASAWKTVTFKVKVR